jgi:hypothetical protein
VEAREDDLVSVSQFSLPVRLKRTSAFAYTGFHQRTGPVLGTYHVQESEERFSKKTSVLRTWSFWKERMSSKCSRTKNQQLAAIVTLGGESRSIAARSALCASCVPMNRGTWRFVVRTNLGTAHVSWKPQPNDLAMASHDDRSKHP